MKLSSLITAAVAAGTALAYPGMDKTLADLRSRQVASGPSTEMLGDLRDLPDRRLTSTGRDIKSILSGRGNPEDLRSSFWLGTPRAGTWLCGLDPCCTWKHIADEMAAAMVGDAGRCNDLARAAIRLGFHDAATWSLGTGGTGADGSIVLTDECARVPDNNGLGGVCQQMRDWHAKYARYGISMADLIQFGANVATVSCPLGPRIRTFIGRKDSNVAPPRGLLPTPFDSADKLLEMFANKTFSADGLVALMGAHSTSQQRFVNPARAGDPQDSTPGVWDVKYYGETASQNPPERVFRFQSDINLANDPRLQASWRAFTPDSAQGAWNRVCRDGARLIPTREPANMVTGLRCRVRAHEPPRRQ